MKGINGYELSEPLVTLLVKVISLFMKVCEMETNINSALGNDLLMGFVQGSWLFLSIEPIYWQQIDQVKFWKSRQQNMYIF